jgi:hypothetical protein
MKTSIAFALAMALAGAIHAAPPSKAASTAGKANTTSAAQAGSSNAIQSNPGNTAATNGSTNNMVCPPGVKPQNANSGKCFPRPTKSVQK